MLAPQHTYGGNAFEQGWRAAQMSFGCGPRGAPERRVNSKRGALMLEDISRDDVDGIFSEARRRKPLALMDRQVEGGEALPPAEREEELPPETPNTDPTDKADKHGLDAMIAGLHAHAAKVKKGGAAKATPKAKCKAKGKGAKIDVKKKPSAPSLVSTATVIKCKKGWLWKKVPRGTATASKGSTYP